MVLCLQWENHQATVINSIITIYESHLLLDCTISAGGQSVRAHKIILAAASPYFQEIFKEDPSKEDFILETAAYEDLRSIIDFIYNGSIELQPEKRASFLELAAFLQIPVLVLNPLLSNARISTDHDSKDIGFEAAVKPSGNECQTDSSENQILEPPSVKKETGVETKEIFDERSIQCTENALGETTTDPLAITPDDLTSELIIKSEKKEIPDTDPLNDKDSATESRRHDFPTDTSILQTWNDAENDNVDMGRDNLDDATFRTPCSVANSPPGSPSSISSKVTVVCDVERSKEILLEILDCVLSEDTSPQSPDNIFNESISPQSPDNILNEGTSPKSPDGAPRSPMSLKSIDTYLKSPESSTNRSPDSVNSEDKSPQSPNSVSSANGSPSEDTSPQSPISVSSANSSFSEDTSPQSPNSLSSANSSSSEDTSPQSPISVSSANSSSSEDTSPQSPNSVSSANSSSSEDTSPQSPKSASSANTSRRPSSESSEDSSFRSVSSKRTSRRYCSSVLIKDSSSRSVSNNRTSRKILGDESSKDSSHVRTCHTSPASESSGDVPLTELVRVHNVKCVNSKEKKVKLCREVSVEGLHTKCEDNSKRKVVAVERAIVPSIRANKDIVNNISDVRVCLKRIEPESARRFVEGVGPVSLPHTSTARRGEGKNSSDGNSSCSEPDVRRDHSSDEKDSSSDKNSPLKRFDSQGSEWRSSSTKGDNLKSDIKDENFVPSIFMTRKRVRESRGSEIENFRKKMRMEEGKRRRRRRKGKRKKTPKTNIYDVKVLLRRIDDEPNFKVPNFRVMRNLFPQMNSESSKDSSRSLRKTPSYRCALCSFSSKRFSSLERHLRKAHSRKSKDVTSQTSGVSRRRMPLVNPWKESEQGMKKEKCEKCGKRKVTEGTGSSSHSQKKCPLNLTLHCENHLDYLKDHIRKHPHKTPYRCKECGLGYKSLSPVRRSLCI